MVSYYPTMPYSQKHHSNNLGYQQWNWASNYHAPGNQFFNDVDTTHPHHQVYYSHMFHAQAPGATADWHSSASSAENFTQNATNAHQMLHQHHVNNLVGSANHTNNPNVIVSNGSASSGSSSSTSSGPNSGNTQLNETNSSISEQHIAEGLPSPPITVSGSEISSPGAPNSSSSPHHISHHMNNNNNNSSSANNNNNNNSNSTSVHNNNRTSPVKSQYYEWMKKPTYPSQPAPGKTRTKDKYRVVYTDYQRLELEKEYCTSRYITIRRKTELAQSLQLSERQVKIWFQNRRAKERKQNKKGSDATMMSSVHNNDYLMETKPKLEHGILPHQLHLNTMQLGMPSMRFNHHLHGHSMMTAQLQQLHNPSHMQMSAAAAAAASVGGPVPM